MFIFTLFLVDFCFVVVASSEEFEALPLIFFLLSPNSPCTHTPNHILYVLLTAGFQHLCAGTHGGIENLMRLFWRGHYSITVSAGSGSDPSCLDVDEALVERRTCTTCETENCHVKWLKSPFEGVPKAWLFQGEMTFSQQYVAATAVLIFFVFEV